MGRTLVGAAPELPELLVEQVGLGQPTIASEEISVAKVGGLMRDHLNDGASTSADYGV